MFNFPTTPQEAGKGTLITFISARQGAGASSLACQAAISAANIKRDVALIDFNPESKVRAYMGFPGAEVTSTSILSIGGVPTPDKMDSACESHHSGVKIFPGVLPKMADVSLINSHLILKGGTFLKQSESLSFAVSGPLYGESWILPMISDMVCVVVRPNRADMDVFRETMEYLARLGCAGRVKIILNQAASPGGINTEDCKAFYTPDIVIPYNKQYIEMCNRRTLKPDNRVKEIMLKLIKEVEEIAV